MRPVFGPLIWPKQPCCQAQVAKYFGPFLTHFSNHRPTATSGNYVAATFGPTHRQHCTRQSYFTVSCCSVIKFSPIGFTPIFDGASRLILALAELTSSFFLLSHKILNNFINGSKGRAHVQNLILNRIRSFKQKNKTKRSKKSVISFFVQTETSSLSLKEM